MSAARCMRVLTIGLTTDAREEIIPNLKKVEEINLAHAADLKKWVSSMEVQTFDAVFAGREITEVTPTEIAQLIRMKIPTTPATFVSNRDSENKDEVNLLRKNGFENIYVLPKHKSLLHQRVHQLEEEWVRAVRRDGWVPVGVCEIEPDTELEFSICLFLRLNDKMIVLANKGDKLDSARLERLNQAGVNEVLVSRQDMHAFTSYSARRLWELTQGTPYLSEDERRAKLHKTVRTLIRGLFNHNTFGRTASEEQRRQATAIVSRFIVKANPPPWLFDFMKQPADLSVPSGRMNLASTLAGLLAIGLEFPNAANVVAAAIFQDIGLADSDMSVPNAPDHPQFSVNSLRMRWDAAPKEVCEAILQHHERWDGKGFPAGLKGEEISKVAQVIALANHFTTVISQNPTEAANPSQILRDLLPEGGLSPSLLWEVSTILEEPGANA